MKPIIFLVAALAACGGSPKGEARAQAPRGQASPAASAPVRETGTSQARPPLSEADAATFRDAAKSAWAFVTRNYQSRTGLVRAHDTYEYVTLWDIASALASYHAAHGLGLIGDSAYHEMAGKALATLAELPLYDGVAYNKMYSSATGQMVDREQRASRTGYGWSVLDLGRLLSVLHVLASTDETLAPTARAVVARLDMKRLVDRGYLQGGDVNLATGKKQVYQEGRIGYEQYAAEGFARWGVRAPKALDFRANAKSLTINGQALLADRRGNDLLTSEPFIMMGLELGWPGDEWPRLSRAVLAAQEGRWKQTGTVTMLSEDAVPEPPAYFYYYLLHRNGKDFVVRTPGGDASDAYPRWVSTKAAFGWHALLPSDYTAVALAAVRPAGGAGRGWTAGVYEGSGRSTKSYNLNSSAVVLESAWYAVRGCPLAQASCPAR